MTQQMDVMINGKIVNKRFICAESQYARAMEVLKRQYPAGTFQSYLTGYGDVYIYMVQ